MKRRNIKIVLVIFIALFLSIYLTYSQKDKNDKLLSSQVDANPKILVVSSLFPWYDLAKEIGGERVNSILLLSPGLDAHSFEPKPQDILKISQSQLFLYTSDEMEPWAKDLEQALNGNNRMIALAEVAELSETENNNEGLKHSDPHIWLDPLIMKDLASHLVDVLSELDPLGSSVYQANLARYQASLERLDEDYRETLSHCQRHELIYAGHSAFAYLARRYQLDYETASGFSPNAESTPARLVALSDKLRTKDAHYLFTDSLENQQLAQALSQNSGLEILTLKTGANLAKTDFVANLNYEAIMRYNLKQLSIGLLCQE